MEYTFSKLILYYFAYLTALDDHLL